MGNRFGKYRLIIEYILTVENGRVLSCRSASDEWTIYGYISNVTEHNGSIKHMNGSRRDVVCMEVKFAEIFFSL